MSSKIKQNTIGKYTCLDFPERHARLLFDNNTKEYEIYSYAEGKAKVSNKVSTKVEPEMSPLWKNISLVTGGICIGMLTVVGLMLL
tara:strand:- start:1882 stop:2139 length:258 start_codon:yes stop_codon:yes gene_type:complete